MCSSDLSLRLSVADGVGFDSSLNERKGAGRSTRYSTNSVRIASRAEANSLIDFGSVVAILAFPLFLYVNFT